MRNWFLERCRVRPLGEQDLVQVLAWRNHADTRVHMFNQAEIDPVAHRKWFESAHEKGRTLLIFENDGLSMGFVNFTNLTSRGVAEWGFYAAPGAPKGTGRQMGQAALAFAFTELKLHKVSGQVISTNERSIRLHEHLGFRREGILREHHHQNNRYNDVLCFGLLSAEWINSSINRT